MGRLLIIATVVAHVVAFLYILRRYVVGIIDISTWQTMISHPAWQPPLGWFILTVLYTVVILLAAQRFFTYLYPGHRLLQLPLKNKRKTVRQ